MTFSYTNEPYEAFCNRAPAQRWRYEIERFLETEWKTLKIECENENRSRSVQTSLCACIKRNGLPVRTSRSGTLVFVIREDTEDANGRIRAGGFCSAGEGSK